MLDKEAALEDTGRSAGIVNLQAGNDRLLAADNVEVGVQVLVADDIVLSVLDICLMLLSINNELDERCRGDATPSFGELNGINVEHS